MTPLSSSSRAAIALPLALTIAILAVALSAAGSVPAATLRAWLVGREFWLLEATCAIAVATTAFELRRIAMDRHLLLRAAGVGIAAVILSATVAPRTNRIYYDEQIYQGVAQNLTDLHAAQMCNDGTLEYGRLQCWRGEFNKEPNGYPYLLTLAYRIVGAREGAAFLVNNLVGGITAILVLLSGTLLFEQRRKALFASLVFVFLPMQLWWTNTAAAEPSAALFAAAAFFAALHFSTVRTISALAWMVAITAFSTTMRPESVLVVPLVVTTVAMRAPDELRRPRTWWAAAAGGTLSLPTLVHLLAVRDESWGAPAARLGWEFVPANLSANGWFYLGSDDRFPVLVTVAAVLGLVAGASRRTALLLAVYFLLFWGIFIGFYAGSYYYGADVRYSVLSHVPMALLAGAGLGWLADWMSRAITDRAATAVVAGLVLLQFSWHLPIARSTGEEAWAARADVEHARQFASALPANAIILTHNPSLFHLWGKNAAQLSLVQTDTTYVRERLFERYTGGVYLHWNFWCNVRDPVQTAFCDSALAAFPSTLVASGQTRDYQYRLYRLARPSS